MHALSTSSPFSLVHRLFVRSRHCCIQLQVSHGTQVKCRGAGFSHLSRPVHRRQVLQNASLGFLTSWLPFSKMTAKAQFHPEQKWWRSDTVAVVTGGVPSLDHAQTHLSSCEVPVHAGTSRKAICDYGISCSLCASCSQQGHRLWYCKTSGRAGPDHCCCCKERSACSVCLL